MTDHPAELVKPERSPRPRWCGGQRRIGLTGGIASGKSTVGRLLAERHGLPVLDADLYAREALAPGSAASRAVLERYGAQVQAVNTAVAPGPRLDQARASAGAELDRAALGRIVFTDAAERCWLEELVHPLVGQRFAAELERLVDAPVVVLMVPLLFEAGLDGLCSEVWVVDCDPQQQLQRLVARDGVGEAEARARIAAQWPLERKCSLADVVIDNRVDGSQLAGAVAAALARSRETNSAP